MSKTLAKTLAFGVIVLTTVIAALTVTIGMSIGLFMPHASLAFALATFAGVAFAAGAFALAAYAMALFALGIAFAGAGNHAGDVVIAFIVAFAALSAAVSLANAAINDHYARKGE